MDKLRRTILLAPFALALAGGPALAQRIPLDDISRYLNALQTAEAEFVQENGDGTISTGKLYIQRPGRMRFEYNPPDEALVLASGGQVAIFDSKSNQPPEQYPLRRTPLNLILERNVNLSRARMVVAHESDGQTTSVVAQDPDNPEYGTIRMIFTANPIALRQWVVTDEVGTETTVILGDLLTGQTYSASTFSIIFEQNRRDR